MSKVKIGLVYDDVFLGHRPPAHVECPERLEVIVRKLKATGWWKKCEHLAVREAEREELLLVHSERMVDLVHAACRRAPQWLDPDTCVTEGSWKAALSAVGSTIDAARAVAEGKVDRALCLVRPPGHHATPERPMGFCLFNNVAIAARGVLEKYGMERVAVVDWDVHHGNGTQEAFAENPRALYVSLHRFPFYPGTGWKSECGRGAGVGYTINLPLSHNISAEDYIEVFRADVVPALTAFEPRMIFISAGFDAHRLDPVGGLGLESETFARLTEIVLSCADSAEGRVVSVLEGGYNLDVLGDCVLAHLEALAK